MAVDHTGIQMKQKEPTKTFMVIQIEKTLWYSCFMHTYLNVSNITFGCLSRPRQYTDNSLNCQIGFSFIGK